MAGSGSRYVGGWLDRTMGTRRSRAMMPRRGPRELPCSERRATALGGRLLRTWSLGVRTAAPPVVMLAGLGYPGMLVPWMRAAAAWTRVTVLDLPGWRGQQAVSCDPTVEGVGAAAAAWIRDAQLPPVVLIGHSTGAQEALRAAIQVSDQLLGVVLAAPTVDPEARSWPRLISRYLLPLWREDPRELPAVAGSMVAAGVRPVLTLIGSALADRPEHRIADLDVPAIVIAAEHDRVASPQWCRRLAAAKAAPCLMLPGGHNSCFPHAAQADAYVRNAIASW